MSTEVVLNATRRIVIGKQVNAMRRAGQLPAVVYGKQTTPFPIMLDLRETALTLRGVPSSHLIKLVVDGVNHTVLVREKQYHVIKRHLIHIDFQAISMDEKLVTRVPVRLVGTAPAIKAHDAMLMTELDELEVEAFPADLPDYIDVDVSSLAELGDTITVSKLSLGDKVEVRHEGDEIIVLAISAVSEEISDEVSGDVAEPEVITKGKKEEEE
ncbi:MAG: 50S ribosomal protein L25 [Anaerolineales bacterium]|nr:50S ribosomal protein L25 [Anaerolineales bacterium]